MARENQGGSQDTRTAIIAAAMRGFAEKGFDATSIREIATMAGVNIASISYHFGGKEGLRAACAEHIVGLMGGVLATARSDEAPPADPEVAAHALAALMRSMLRFLLLAPEARLVAGFMMREMARPSSALDTIYEGLFESVHRRACALWAAATGMAPEAEATRLAVFGMIGQIVYFHLGRPVIQRRMGWPEICAAEVDAIAETLTSTLAARLDADRRERR